MGSFMCGSPSYSWVFTAVVQTVQDMTCDRHGFMQNRPGVEHAAARNCGSRKKKARGMWERVQCKGRRGRRRGGKMGMARGSPAAARRPAALLTRTFPLGPWDRSGRRNGSPSWLIFGMRCLTSKATAARPLCWLCREGCAAPSPPPLRSREAARQAVVGGCGGPQRFPELRLLPSRTGEGVFARGEGVGAAFGFRLADGQTAQPGITCP